MAIQTLANTKLFIGTTAVATDQTTYEADTYIQVKNISTMGEIGDSSNPVNLSLIDDAREQFAKGTRPAQGGDYELAFLASDPGQQACIAAEADNESIPYNFYREEVDGTKIYFSGVVFSFRGKGGTVDDVMMVTMTLQHGKTLEVAAP